MTETSATGLAPLVTNPAALADEEDLYVVYLRRKPSRGLIALHAGPRGELRMAGKRRLACVSVDETTLREGDVNGTATVSWFPDDAKLGALESCCEPRVERRLWSALEQAAHRVNGFEGRLIGAWAEVLRYKPHDRCLLRYRLVLARGNGAPVELGVIGKLYRHRERARHAHTIAQHLHRQEPCAVARPLGVINALGVALFEDVSAVASAPGNLVLRPSHDAPLPERELRGAAAALAALHACSPIPDLGASRAASREAATALERAQLLARSAPSLSAQLRSAGMLLRDALLALADDHARLVHGSFKPSQLLFGSDERVVVTDLDNACLADPALDLGYFLAYLRPAALWRGSAAARAWFNAAAECFRREYAAAAHRAMTRVDVDDALVRASAYEAATLLKIAGRRVRRLNSPRPRELAAIVAEMYACLGATPEPAP
jgi:aminoglycoside phosphotransferase (APT) family kinase protein